MKRFVYIGYFQGLLCLCFTSIKSIKGSIEESIKNIRDISITKVSKILRKRYMNKIS